MQTNHKLRENPNDGLVLTFESGEMDSNFAVENALLFGMASFAGHGETLAVTNQATFMLRLAVIVRCSKLNTIGERCPMTWLPWNRE
jgi:hypothetical protein